MVRSALKVCALSVATTISACSPPPPPAPPPAAQNAGSTQQTLFPIALDPALVRSDAANAKACLCENTVGESKRAGCGCTVQQCADNCAFVGSVLKSMVESQDCKFLGCEAPTVGSFNVRVTKHDPKNGDPPQCGGGTQGGAFGHWSQPVVLRTDGHQGGCEQDFTIRDPKGQLSGMRFFVEIQPMLGADAGQCFSGQHPLGRREIPVHTVTGGWSSPTILVDTDTRAGGCLQTFSVEGTNRDFFLEIQHFPEFGNNKGQCGKNVTTPSTPHRIGVGQSITLTLDMDFQSGCAQQFRIVGRGTT